MTKISLQEYLKQIHSFKSWFRWMLKTKNCRVVTSEISTMLWHQVDPLCCDVREISTMLWRQRDFHHVVTSERPPPCCDVREIITGRWRVNCRWPKEKKRWLMFSTCSLDRCFLMLAAEGRSWIYISSVQTGTVPGVGNWEMLRKGIFYILFRISWMGHNI